MLTANNEICLKESVVCTQQEVTLLTLLGGLLCKCYHTETTVNKHGINVISEKYRSERLVNWG